MNRKIYLLLFLVVLISCKKDHKKLPVLSKYTISSAGDTLYQKIPEFRFTDQDSLPFESHKLSGKIHVADFIFTSCPGICIAMTDQMKRLQEMTKDLPDYKLVSFTVDPDRDTPSVLKDYAKRQGADLKKWVFLTGNMDSIYKVGEKGYYLGMQKDSTEPGGYLHSGRFVLVDKQGLIRGYYDGTNVNEINDLVRDLHILKQED